MDALTAQGKKNTQVKKKKLGWWYKEKIPVTEDIRQIVMYEIDKLVNDPDKEETTFPVTFTSSDRAFAHQIARRHNLQSTSSGKEPNRQLKVFKDENFHQLSKVFQQCKISSKMFQDINIVDPTISLHNSSLKVLRELQPDKFSQTLTLWRDKANLPVVPKDDSTFYISRPVIPSNNTNISLQAFRKTLPIWSSKNAIIDAINSHQIVIISGETGCGKTTQVPQFLMEDATSKTEGCRIICSMPRRVAAVSVSERVATERNQLVGHEVGYRIRFESRESPKTVITFCTTGVLLRCLLSGEALLSTVTHIIMDEIHERDKLSDFTLTYLKEVLPRYPKLKLVLMSATIDTDKFSEYFRNIPTKGDECPVLTVSGRVFRVEEFYLEDLLKNLPYMTDAMLKLKEERKNYTDTSMKIDTWSESKPDSPPIDEPTCDQSEHHEEVDKSNLLVKDYEFNPLSAMQQYIVVNIISKNFLAMINRCTKNI